MAIYKHFEDLPIWQTAKELAVATYKMTKSGNWTKDLGFKNQIQRAAISISSNIAEGFERNSKKEFIQFLYIARGSCGELRSQVSIALEVGYISKESFNLFHGKTVSLSKQISGFVDYLKK